MPAIAAVGLIAVRTTQSVGHCTVLIMPCFGETKVWKGLVAQIFSQLKYNIDTSLNAILRFL